ncbi:uncharacterized protein LOC110406907 isoform X2 [Numida meleagris]|uniref:uncharacterized protein LOC110406907 isoform X2 n=1 Tax=Numida meleagris TaxID=8996 RepID=UPI000B3E1025|nr:uncharacterized protein LOC110406907 isoform X2 [Numida meleagris]
MAAGPPGCGRSEAERGPASSHGAGCERGPRPALGASPHPGNADEIGTSASACSSPRCEPRFPLGSLKKQRGVAVPGSSENTTLWLRAGWGLAQLHHGKQEAEIRQLHAQNRKNSIQTKTAFKEVYWEQCNYSSAVRCWTALTPEQ